MSVMIIDKTSIRAIATYAWRNKLLPKGLTATRFARALSAANCETYNTRYEHHGVNEKPLKRFIRVKWDDHIIDDLMSSLSCNVDWFRVTDDDVVAAALAVQRALPNGVDGHLVMRSRGTHAGLATRVENAALN